jgi:N-acetylglucosaminyldiphosphoundecaprenol N-acetyl-beta-D-mannosaminyltransferase
MPQILGVKVDQLELKDAIDQISLMIQRRQGYVCLTNVYTVMQACQYRGFRQIINKADLSLADGMPIVWAVRLNGYRLRGRVYGPDLMLEFCKYSLTCRYRHFLYGGRPDTLARLSDRLRRRFPGISIVGSFAPPFRPLRPNEDKDVTSLINRSGADVVWVGLGSPKQEIWMAEHRDRVSAVMIGVGAAFDFLSGAVPQAPKWIQDHGLEWLHRLFQEPRRLWKRYLIYNPLFVLYLALEHIGFKRYR